jgi:hypothetical protein
MTVKKNVIKTVNRQPTSSYEDIVDADGNIIVIPCRAIRSNSGKIIVYILAKYYDLVPGGLHRNYQANIEGINQTFTFTNEPFFAGGVRHHIEAQLEELA